MKAQAVRLLDVFVIGPTLIAWAARGQLSEADRIALAALGALTIVYNGANWIKVRHATRH